MLVCERVTPSGFAHELLHYLEAEKSLDIEQQDPHTEKFLQDQAEKMGVDATELTPLSLWGDGVAFSKKKSLFCILIGFHPSVLMPRYPVTLLPEKTPELMKQVWAVLTWSLTCSAAGIYPEQRLA